MKPSLQETSSSVLILFIIVDVQPHSATQTKINIELYLSWTTKIFLLEDCRNSSKIDSPAVQYWDKKYWNELKYLSAYSNNLWLPSPIVDQKQPLPNSLPDLDAETNKKKKNWRQQETSKLKNVPIWHAFLLESIVMLNLNLIIKISSMFFEN